jgi:adenylate kinase family enzyme
MGATLRFCRWHGVNVRLERVIVVGTSCCGKTTFSKRLSGILQQPHIELDALYWGPNWEPKPADEFRSLVDHATSSDRWVVDGNYSAVRNLIWPKGDGDYLVEL